MGLRTFVQLALLVVLVNSAPKLPSTFKKCNRIDPDFNRCLAQAVENAVGQMNKPIKELGFPSVDPLVLPSLVVPAGPGVVKLTQNYKNVKLMGYTTISVPSFEIDFDKKVITFVAIFKVGGFEAEYDFNGKLLLLPVFGNGPCKIVMDKPKSTNTMTYELQTKKNGKTYMKVTSSKMLLEPEHVSYRFDNLFNGDKTLGDNINKVLNDNWSEVFMDVKDGYEEAYARANMGLANQIFSKLSVNELFGPEK